MVGMGSLCLTGAHAKELLTPNSVLLVRGTTLLDVALVTALVRGTLLLLQSDTTDRNLSGAVGSRSSELEVVADGSGDL